MMGVPGMRSAVLPLESFLAVSRVRFMARLTIRTHRTSYGLFDLSAGQLVDRIQPSLLFWTAKDLEPRLGIVNPAVFEGSEIPERVGWPF